MLWKADLLAAIAGKNRGKTATDDQKAAIAIAVARLEDHNPTPRPTEAVDLLAGDWRLLYTTNQELLGLDRLPLTQTREIYQCIRTEGNRIYNIAEISSLPGLSGLVSVVARFEVVSERRVNVIFERAIAGLQSPMRYQSPQDFIQRIEAGQKFFGLDLNLTPRDRAGWLDITYLDQELRIGRGNEGSIFVLARS